MDFEVEKAPLGWFYMWDFFYALDVLRVGQHLCECVNLTIADVSMRRLPHRSTSKWE